MKALIITAGDGRRLRPFTLKNPKSLISILGLKLIERVILSAKHAGIKEFVLVIGYLGDKLKKALGNGEKYGVEIEYVENKEWGKPNGVSVYRAKSKLKENFVLLMSDHLFDSKILTKFKDYKIGKEECALCVDKNISKIFDVKGATKVKVVGNKIKAIGKNLKRYNAIDTGMFLCSPHLFKVLEKNIKKGKCSLTDSMKTLARENRMRVFETDNFWLDVDTKEDLKFAEKSLLKNLTKPTDGPISKLINRKISTRMSKLLVKTNVKPNTLSFVNFLIASLSGFFFMLSSYTYTIIAGLLAQLASIVDGCDGEVARLKYLESKYGAWFDACLDKYGDTFMIFGITYGLWISTNNIAAWIMGFITIAGMFMNAYTSNKYYYLFGKHEGEVKAGEIRLQRDVPLFIIMLGALLNQLFFTLLIIAILMYVKAVSKLIVLREK